MHTSLAGSMLKNHQVGIGIATIDGFPVPKSPVVPVPVESLIPSLAQRYRTTFLRYAGIGIIGTMVHFLTLFLLVGLTTPVVASSLGAIAGCITNFRLSRLYVFTVHPGQSLVFPKFATVATGSIALNAAIMSILTPFLPLIVCQSISTGSVLVTGFFLNSIWSFGEFRR